jgi:hypothetical protein
MKHPHTAYTRTLGDVRMALLRLHKKLLDAEQLRYERENGRIESGGVLLQLVIHDPFFAWLRPLSGLVVQIDEEIEGDEPMTDDRARTMIREIRTMLLADEQGETFQKNYHRALQNVPDIVIAHREVTRLLDLAPPSPGGGVR